MRKLLISLLAVGSTGAFAIDNSLFQEFDNQISIGYGMNQTTSSYGTHPGMPSDLVANTNMLNLEAEHLFDNGIWADVNANMAFGAGAVEVSPNGYINNTYGLNGKLGYAFPLAGQHVQITPYVVGGLNNNSSTFPSEAGLTTGVVANDMYYTLGLGARVEYRINRAIQFYADQSAAYNWDQSGPVGGTQPQNFLLYTSTVGVKYNAAKNLQFGLKGYYNIYENKGSNYACDGSGAIGSCGFGPQATNGFGGLVSVGLTY